MDNYYSILWSFIGLCIGAIIGSVVAVSDYKNDHGPGGFFYEKEKLKRLEYRQGIEHAAFFIRQFNSCTTHDYDLGDCLLAKFNMLSSKNIRRNKRRLDVIEKFKPYKRS